MSTTTPPPFRFYKSFFTNDAHNLSEEEKTRLFSLLQRLQENPTGPEFEESDGFYAAQFSPGLVVYWKPQFIQREGLFPTVSGIDVLKVRRISDR